MGVLVSSTGVPPNGELPQQVGEHNTVVSHLDPNVTPFLQRSRRDAIGDMTGLVDPTIQELRSSKSLALQLSLLSLVRNLRVVKLLPS